MRIGEISQRTGVSISTIRYYIQLGLLVPDRCTSQYQFNDEDLVILELIAELKKWGFSLEEIYRLVSLRRFSGGVEPEDQADCIALLIKHQKKLQTICVQYQKYIEEIDTYIEKLNQGCDRQRSTGYIKVHTGVPIQTLGILCCPHCQSSLQINNANMNSNYIFDGILCCKCGYSAEIRNGIVYSLCEQTYPFDKADIDRSLYRSSPNELVSLIQKSYNWMSLQIKDLPLTNRKVIMETHLNSFFYLYKHFNDLGANHIYIVQDKFADIIELYKKYIEQMGIELNILYLAASDQTRLPIRNNCLDLLIDYNSTNEYGIFSQEFYLDRMREYLKPSAFVLGTYFYFDTNSRSLKKLISSYPHSNPKNYTLDYFLSGIAPHYRLLRRKTIGISRDSGPGITFIFHQTGEKLYMDGFLLKVLPGTS